MHTAYLGLGSNRGDRPAHLQAAVDGLGQVPEVDVTAVSPVYETEAHTLDPEDEQRAFLNAVAEADVACTPDQLLQHAHDVETRRGRVREKGARWTPRPLDIDLLVVGPVTCDTETLTLPHPRLAERRFVLRPWADLAPAQWVPAPFETSVERLLEACSDTASMRPTTVSLMRPDDSSPEASSEGP